MTANSLTIFLVALLLTWTCTAGNCEDFQPRPLEPPGHRNANVEKNIVAGEAAAKDGNLADAEKFYKLAESQYNRGVSNPDMRQIADILTLLQNLYDKEERYDLSVRYAKKLIAIETKMYGPEHILVAEDYKRLADIQYDAARYEEAKALYLSTAKSAAKAAAAAGYYWCVVSAEANAYKKLNLVIGCYEGLANCCEEYGDIAGADNAYKIGVEACAKLDEPYAGKQAAEIVMLDRYAEYLSKHMRGTEARVIEQRAKALRAVAEKSQSN